MFSFCRNLSRPLAPAAETFLPLRPRQTLSLCRDAPGLSFSPSRRSSGAKRFNVPPSAEFVARVSGIPTMAKLPHRDTADGLDAAFVGVPIDTGTSNRPGAREVWSIHKVSILPSSPDTQRLLTENVPNVTDSKVT
ncbi:hypothetical protein L3Q82_003590 [Scortum barcoo]|uniref:Uncharacterized protein n=1 Tax=Scortum barcoo TaxID=214431 RepID=A0ACB8VN97_9TELE|nr:hypothetical protein L3Q82_003590 [Scortum barcoo]